MINADNYELYLFRYAEGLLDEDERREVETFLQQRPDLAEALQLYAEAPTLRELESLEGHEPLRLSRDEKEALKHAEPQLRPLWWKAAAAVAAIVLCGIMLFSMIDRPRPAERLEALQQVQPKANAVAEKADAVEGETRRAASLQAAVREAPPIAQEEALVCEAPLRKDNQINSGVVNSERAAAVNSQFTIHSSQNNNLFVQEEYMAENVSPEPFDGDAEDEELLDPVATMALAYAVLSEYSTRQLNVQKSEEDNQIYRCSEFQMSEGLKVLESENLSKVSKSDSLYSQSPAKGSRSSFYEGLQARIDSRLVPLSASFVEVSVEVACLFSNIKEVYQSFEEIASQQFQSGWMQKIEDIL